MTRSESFKELLQVLAAVRAEEDHNLFVLLEVKFNAVEKEFKEAVEDVRAEYLQYWQDVVAGESPKYITLDNGKTFLRLTAIPDKPGPNDKVMYVSTK